MPYAFISYSTQNQAAADAMREFLKKNQIDTWMAPGDIPAGQRYAAVIAQAVKDCACVVLMLTDAAQNSVWVAKEIERAVNYRKPIIPVQLEDVVLNNEFELYISSDQIVAVQKIDERSPELQKVLTSVSALVGSSKRTVEAAPREESKPVYPFSFTGKKPTAAPEPEEDAPPEEPQRKESHSRSGCLSADLMQAAISEYTRLTSNFTLSSTSSDTACFPQDMQDFLRSLPEGVAPEECVWMAREPDWAGLTNHIGLFPQGIAVAAHKQMYFCPWSDFAKAELEKEFYGLWSMKYDIFLKRNGQKTLVLSYSSEYSCLEALKVLQQQLIAQGI